MDRTIPYHNGLFLGQSVDMKQFEMGPLLINENMKPLVSMPYVTTSQFAVIHSLKDVCNILNIAPEYALKVKNQNITNATVSACLDALGLEDACTIIFKASFIQQRQSFSGDIIPTCSHAGVSDNATSENLINDAAANNLVSGTSIQHNGTHWVKAMDYGDELICILTISCKDQDKLKKMWFKILEGLRASAGNLDHHKIEYLHKVAPDIDKKLKKSHYNDVKLVVKYCYFNELPKYPTSFTGMVKQIDSFLNNCVGWAEGNKHGAHWDLKTLVMSCETGTDQDETISVFKKFTNFLKQDILPGSSYHNVEYNPEAQTAEIQNDDREGSDGPESFVVLENSGIFYPLRATLQSFVEETNDNEGSSRYSSIALSTYPESTYNIFEKLYTLQHNCCQAADLIQEFLKSPRFLKDNRVKEGNQVLQSIMSVHMKVIDMISNLDLVTLPPDESLDIQDAPLETVKIFIEKVTSKLPPGNDIDLLMIGKTGHGKSSTGNSILGQNKFLASADGTSVTALTSVGWAEIDGRTIKVVDTPGVCDTNEDTEESSIDLAIKSISDAIANCPEGFHALLLIVRFGIRMTLEEKKAIGLLKCVLGDDVIKSHCICILTHGDNFEKEIKVSFEDWCKSQRGFLKDLFEECDHRCVLFNNKAEDPKVIKGQLIDLVAKVDSLKENGTRYTNALFDFAQRERLRIISEKQVPQVNEDLMRDILLILEYLTGMVNNTNQEHYKEELARLKEKVDNLVNKVSESENGQLEVLVTTVFSLAATIHSRMDEIADTVVPPETEPSLPENTQAKKSVSHYDNTDLERHRGELQNYFETEISPVSNMVNEEVSEKLKEKVNEKQCFPENSTVKLASGRWIPMKELKIGDQVLTRDSYGHLSYSPVYMFGHQDFKAVCEFTVLKTVSTEVSLTDGHYVYCERNGKEECYAAKDIKLGDKLLLATEDGFVGLPVQEIRHEQKQGLFAPFTENGTLVVDGLLMSCYINVLPQNYCHQLLWPVRQVYKLSPCTLAYINGDTSKQPVPWWANAISRLL
ncbi:unnamed protein product [Lymnaea stagnalis]|uniref:AIG1-type G domain-containing protein n=1 Tax=Lymnaea stagnalis TaxID=6523 RepID=A0AAV2I3Z4_LYMST